MFLSILRSRPASSRVPALASAAVASFLAFTLVACGDDDDESSTADEAADAGASSVAALSSDAAEAVRALVGADRLIAVPASTTNETLGNHPDEMDQVPNKVPPSSGLDPEQVLAWDPDLVVLTARHDGEEDAEELLKQTDVPLVTIENNWGSIEQLQENYHSIAEALGGGAEQRADELIAEMDQELADVTADVQQAADGGDAPSVLVLTNQAENPFIAGPDSMTTDVVRQAGGTPVVEEAGIRGTMPADPERIVDLAPDAILLVDVMGKGQESFDSLLGNEAVAELPAVAEDRVLLLPGRSALAAGGMHVVDGVREVADWLHAGSGAETSGE